MKPAVLTLLALAAPLACPAQVLPAGEEFRVISGSSWLRVLVYRGGLLRRFGHNHVVSVNEITGTVNVAPDPLESTLLLEFKVADLMVDEPASRALEGEDFRSRISEQDIAGTRANLLGKKLLQANEFPTIQIRSERITGNFPDVKIEATVVVRETEFTVVFPARVSLSDDLFVASGELEINHREIGLSPFKAGLGTLRVRDTLMLKYEISGARISAPE